MLVFIFFISRYGKPGCDAETCDYFLSYRRIGTDVEYEMSADTDGWVAVGFSSDKKMVSSRTPVSCLGQLNARFTPICCVRLSYRKYITMIYNQTHEHEKGVSWGHDMSQLLESFSYLILCKLRVLKIKIKT